MLNDFKFFSIHSLSADILTIPLQSLMIENMNLVEITGEAGSGKTQLCIYFILKTILPRTVGGLEKGALYISTVQKLSMSRFEQFLSSMGEKLNEKDKNYAVGRMFIKHLSHCDYQQFLDVELEKLINAKDIKTIIVDSITGIADTQFIKDNNEINFIERTKFLKNSSWFFKRLIVKYNLFFFVTNNVSANFKEGENSVKPTLGLIWENAVNTRIFLLKKVNSRGDYERGIKIVFSNHLPLKTIGFSFTNEGFSFSNDVIDGKEKENELNE